MTIVAPRAGPSPERVGYLGQVPDTPSADVARPSLSATRWSSPRVRDYLVVSTYHPDHFPLDSLRVIHDDSLVLFGLLSSRAFWVWARVATVSGHDIELMTAFDTFPFPPLTRAQRFMVETAADTVLRSRMHFLETTLPDLYRAMPGQVRVAHQLLDSTVEAILGMDSEATDEQLSGDLHDRYQMQRAAWDDCSVAGHRPALCARCRGFLAA